MARCALSQGTHTCNEETIAWNAQTTAQNKKISRNEINALYLSHFVWPTSADPLQRGLDLHLVFPKFSLVRSSAEQSLTVRTNSL
mmetsp:Transcript_4231/g.11967  ORF Transcript_4231/g.11967 Transcript_4231/m.11967 type:complete len:85 (+) Transcript_4231:621-875(+)